MSRSITAEGATGRLESLSAAVLFGATTPLLKILAPANSALWSAAILYLGAGLLVAPWVLRDRSPRLPAPAAVRLALAALLGGCAGPILLLRALDRAGAADVSLWLGLETVFTAAIAHRFFREHLTPKAWMAFGLILVAGVLAAGRSSAGPLSATLVGAACLCWAIDNNLGASLAEVPPMRFVLMKGTVGALVSALLAMLAARPAPRLGAALPLLGVGAIGYGASLVLYLRAARRLGAARSQAIFACAPLVGVSLAWVMFSEPVDPPQILAAGILAGGLLLLASETHVHPHPHEAVVHAHEHRHDDGHHDHAHPGLPAGVSHTHEHGHESTLHDHPHLPDVHHRHIHRRS